MAKLREANAKYKNLLKMAKERIQEQEGVLEERRCEYFVELIVFGLLGIFGGMFVVSSQSIECELLTKHCWCL